LSDIIFLALLIVHVGTVVLWMGASILYVSVLGPSITKLSPSSRADLMKTIGSAYERYVVWNATIAIAAGLILYGYITQVSKSLAPTSSGLVWIVAGVLFGLVAYIIGIMVVTRSNRKLMRMMSQSTTSSSDSGGASGEMRMVQRRLAVGGSLQALFLLLALLSMVVGANI
jgi:uncharacterized membrane protein